MKIEVIQAINSVLITVTQEVNNIEITDTQENSEVILQPIVSRGDGKNGVDGKGFTGGSYDNTTGVVTFTSDDGLGFVTGDLRGADGVDGTNGTDGVDGTNGTNGIDGTNGTDGTDGLGFTGGSYDNSNGIVTFTSDDGLGFVTGDLRGEQGIQGVKGDDGADGTNGTNGIDGTNGTNGTDGNDGTNGTDGLGFTGGNYNVGTGVVTFTSNDGLGFATGDLRGANGSNGTDGTDGTDGANGEDGTNGTDGTDGLGFTGGSYDSGSGVVTFTSDDGLGFATTDLRGSNGTDGTDGNDGADGTNGTNGIDGLGFTGGSYDSGSGVVTFTSDDGLGFATSDLRGANGTNGNDGADGQGVPTGGSAGQVLEKIDGTDYNTQWVTPSGGGGGTTINFFQVQDNSGAGQTLTGTNSYADINSSIWNTAFSGTGFSWDGSELTVSSASDAIEFNVSIQGITALNNRVEIGVRLMEDTGSGYTTLTTVNQYALRNNVQNEGNVTLVSFYAFNVASGTKYKIQTAKTGVNCEIGTQGGTYFNAKRFS